MEFIDVIRARWKAAHKLQGLANTITIPNGEQLAGRYILTESGTATPSHDALGCFCKSLGFPTDANGNTVNDRDYERDADAQQTTRNIAAKYDNRALQSPVIVTADGVVLSGNGRTMAGVLAAFDGTDTAYIEYLAAYPQQFGFTTEQVRKFRHPRVLFLLDEAQPYDARTFAKFNAQEMKSQSKTEQAAKYGKVIDGETFGRIVSTINAFETLADFYACTEAATRCINDLRSTGAVDAMQYAQMFDGDTISTTGRETLENVLIGKAFADNPDAARQITAYKSVRKTVITALAEIANNLQFAADYTLAKELSDAVGLVYNARNAGYHDGERVSDFARQRVLFADDTATMADCRNTVVLTIADVLNDQRTTQLKKYMAVYNHQAADAAAGQTDMFCAGGIKTKSEILDDVQKLFATATKSDQNTAITASVAQRTADHLFVSDTTLKSVSEGGFATYRTKAGDEIVCHVDKIKNSIVYLSGKGGIKLWATTSELKPTADHNLSLPEWIEAGHVITDGTASQRIIAVTDTHVIFEWINGGYFDVGIGDVLQNWHLSADGICEIKEAA